MEGPKQAADSIELVGIISDTVSHRTYMYSIIHPQAQV